MRNRGRVSPLTRPGEREDSAYAFLRRVSGWRSRVLPFALLPLLRPATIGAKSEALHQSLPAYYSPNIHCAGFTASRRGEPPQGNEREQGRGSVGFGIFVPTAPHNVREEKKNGGVTVRHGRSLRSSQPGLPREGSTPHPSATKVCYRPFGFFPSAQRPEPVLNASHPARRCTGRRSVRPGLDTPVFQVRAFLRCAMKNRYCVSRCASCPPSVQVRAEPENPHPYPPGDARAYGRTSSPAKSVPERASKIFRIAGEHARRARQERHEGSGEWTGYAAHLLHALSIIHPLEPEPEVPVPGWRAGHGRRGRTIPSVAAGMVLVADHAREISGRQLSGARACSLPPGRGACAGTRARSSPPSCDCARRTPGSSPVPPASCAGRSPRCRPAGHHACQAHPSDAGGPSRRACWPRSAVMMADRWVGYPLAGGAKWTSS